MKTTFTLDDFNEAIEKMRKIREEEILTVLDALGFEGEIGKVTFDSKIVISYHVYESLPILGDYTFVQTSPFVPEDQIIFISDSKTEWV